MNHWRELVFVTCLLSYTARMVSSQRYGPGNCLLSRLDVVPCQNFFPNNPLTPEPGENQFSIYRTKFNRGPAGLPICFLEAPPESKPGVQPIASIGSMDQVKFLISPGIELPQPELYGNQELMTYNVQCPEGHIAFFNLTFADMEPANCVGRCVDYLMVDRSPFGTSESCGNETQADASPDQLELGSFTAQFRTSPSVRRRGFKATVICFRQEDPPPDCTMPDETGEAMNSESPGKRRKRDLEEFYRTWHWHLTYLKRMKRQFTDIVLRFQEINVAHQVIVNFTDKTLVFTDTRTNTILTDQSVEDILFLHTFDAAGNVDEFRENALNNEGKPLPFPGPGPMFIVGRHAYFQLFVIDPRGLLPNANETAVINVLTNGQFDAISLEDTPLNEDFLLPPTPNPEEIGLPPLRRKRQTQAGINYDDQVLLAAIRFQNACNPVLRAQSRATIDSADQNDIDRLRQTISTTTAGTGSGLGMPTTLAPAP